MRMPELEPEYKSCHCKKNSDVKKKKLNQRKPRTHFFQELGLLSIKVKRRGKGCFSKIGNFDILLGWVIY